MVLVLGTALILSILAVVSLRAARFQSDTLGIQKTGIHASQLAVSGIQHASHLIKRSPTWRSQFASPDWSDEVPFDQGFIAWRVVDAQSLASVFDPNLEAGEDLRPIRLFGRGRVGIARHQTSVELSVSKVPHDALRCAVATQGAIDWTNGSIDSQIHCAGTVLAEVGLKNSVSLIGNVRAPQLLNNGTIQGDVQVEQPNASFPTREAFNYYRSLATILPWNPNFFVFVPDAECYRLRTNTLGNGVHQFPMAVSNPHEVYYVLVPGGLGKLEFNCLRMAATWIIDVQGPGTVIQIGGQILWSPPRADFPSAIIRNAETVILDASSMEELSEEEDENLAGPANYNPVGFPFFGSEDDDTEDEYPNGLFGLFHIVGGQQGIPTEVRLGRHLKLKGSIIAPGTIRLDGSASELAYLQIEWDAQLETSPPVGYFQNRFVPAAGSWRQEIVEEP